MNIDPNLCFGLRFLRSFHYNFFSFWAGGFFGGMMNFIFPTAANVAEVHFGKLYLTIGVAVFFLFPILTLAIKWLNYRNTSSKANSFSLPGAKMLRDV